MRKLTNLLILFILAPVISFSQVKSKVWYDGNSRAMFYRDALSGDLKKQDTTSTRSEGEGYTAIDLGIHFTPNKDIEILSEIRIKNDFGFMWGAGSYVDLRRLSVKGILQNRVNFNIGDIYLKQTEFTLYNNEHELSLYEPYVFKAYRDLITYENYYLENYWRMQGIQTNFSYTFYNFLKNLDIDLFTSRVKGVEWLGDPELLMLGGTSLFRLSNNIVVNFHHVNSFEVQSSSLDTSTYYNPVSNIQLSHKRKIGNKSYNLDLQFGNSIRQWKSTTSFDFPKISGYFLSGSVKIKSKNMFSSILFNYVDPNFRSVGAQTRRVQYETLPSTYAYYTNNTLIRPIGLLDITTDPNIYNQYLSTKLMPFNPLYTSVLPYGKSTPNRLGFMYNYNYFGYDFLSSKSYLSYFKEIAGQGTTEKRNFLSFGFNVDFKLHKFIKNINKSSIEFSLNVENINRSGNDLEKIDLKTNLVGLGATYELFKDLKLISGIKIFAGKGNEVETIRDDFDQIIDFDLKSYDTNESISLVGLQYNFSDDIYLTLQTNKINFTDNISDINKLSLSRVYFMFNMNL